MNKGGALLGEEGRRGPTGTPPVTEKRMTQKGGKLRDNGEKNKWTRVRGGGEGVEEAREPYESSAAVWGVSQTSKLCISRQVFSEV